MGWILMGKSMHHDTTMLARYVPDLAKSKFHVWITKYHYVPIIVLGLILLALGGLLWVVYRFGESPLGKSNTPTSGSSSS